jgi:hypothetical protein
MPDDIGPEFQLLERETKIKRLRLSFCDMDYDPGYIAEMEARGEELGHPIIDLLKCCTKLEQAVILYDPRQSVLCRRLVDVLVRLPALRDLHLNRGGQAFSDLLEDDSTIFPCLERLVLSNTNHIGMVSGNMWSDDMVRC